MKEITRAVRERSGGVKLGGATPQNTIVGQLSKGATTTKARRRRTRDDFSARRLTMRTRT
ncbi:hypothetical protein N9S31_01660 [bacterium]|nr:hypothetical protein [bacterium]